MKKFFISLLLGFVSLSAYCQFGALIVNDPMNYAQITSMLQEGVEQTQKMEQQLSFLKDAKEKIDYVNDKIKTLQTIDKLISLGKSTIDDIKTTSSLVSNMQNVKKEYVLVTVNRCSRYSQRILDKLGFIADILTDETYRLNDAERLNQIDKAMNEIELLSLKTHQTSINVKRVEERYNFLKDFK